MNILSLFSFAYNRNKQKFYLAGCDIANEYVNKHCFNEELGYIDPSLIAGVNVHLFSHYTCICGKCSGEGKSEFVSLLEAVWNMNMVKTCQKHFWTRVILT